MSINIIANAITSSDTMSGGDRIFIECARRWARDGHTINIFTPEEGIAMCKRAGLDNVNYILWSSSRYSKFGRAFLYLMRTIKGSLAALKMPATQGTVVYSSSDFWPDSIPGFVMSRIMKSSKWVTAFYLFAPKPFTSESPYRGRQFLRGLLYYLSQLPTYWLINRYADMVFVTNEPDGQKFIGKRRRAERVVAVQGGVDFQASASVPEPAEKEYDAVFIGRFHPQKGVLELVDIWGRVVHRRPGARVAVIGVGELEGELRQRIERLGLQPNIELLGFQDGLEKMRIFKSARVVVHPAIYDSGGMAACEAMACGLPGVSFDLPALKTYYPKGLIKTPCYDLDAFAENIIRLLEDKELYRTTQGDALGLAREWDWDRRAGELLSALKEIAGG